VESEILRDEIFDGFWSESLNARDPDLEPALRLGSGAIGPRPGEFRGREPGPGTPSAPPELEASSDFVRRFEERVGRLERLSGNCRAPGDRGLFQIRSLMAVRDGLEDLDPEEPSCAFCRRGRSMPRPGTKRTGRLPLPWPRPGASFAGIARDREETLANFGGHVASRLRAGCAGSQPRSMRRCRRARPRFPGAPPQGARPAARQPGGARLFPGPLRAPPGGTNSGYRSVCRRKSSFFFPKMSRGRRLERRDAGSRPPVHRGRPQTVDLPIQAGRHRGLPGRRAASGCQPGRRSRIDHRQLPHGARDHLVGQRSLRRTVRAPATEKPTTRLHADPRVSRSDRRPAAVIWSRCLPQPPRARAVPKGRARSRRR